MTFMKAILLLSFLLVAIGNSSAQTGTIRGILTDKETGEAVPFAKVIVFTQDSVLVNGQYSDFDGLFSIPKIPEGVYDVQIINLGYKTIILEDIDLKANGIETFKLEIEPSSQELQEIRIEGYHAINNSDR